MFRISETSLKSRWSHCKKIKHMKNIKYTKGGRPSKKTHEKLKYQICLKLNTEEEFRLRALCKEANLSKQDYIRQCIVYSVVVQRMTPEIADLIRKLAGMANNLNQIAKKANQMGYVEIRTEYLYLAENIDIVINQLKK